MPFSGTTFSEIDAAKDEVKKIIARNKERLERAKAEFGAVSTAMSVAGAEYGPIVGAAANLLASSPTSTAYKNLNDAIQAHLNDFNVVSSEASALDALINSQ